MRNIRNLYDYTEDLKKFYPKLSDFELLSIAVQLERNDILCTSLAISKNNRYPTALESNTIQLEQTDVKSKDEDTFIDVLFDRIGNTEKDNTSK